MKKLWSIVILFGCLLLGSTISLRAQNIDSLKAELKKAKHDTTRCNILNAMIEAESDDAVWPKYNLALMSLAETKLKATKQNNPEYKFYQKHLANALNNVGYFHKLQGNTPKALEYNNKSLKILEEIENKEGIATLLNNIGRIYHDQGDIPHALEYFGKSLKIREEIGDKEGIAGSLINIGAIYKQQGEIPKSLEYYTKSLNLFEEIENLYGIAKSLNNIGTIYRDISDINKAIEYFGKSLKIQEKIGDKNGVATTLSNIGATYFDHGDTPKALDYFEKSLKKFKEIGDNNGVSHCLSFLAVIYENLGNITKALEYNSKSLKIKEEIGDKEGIAISLNNFGGIYKGQGDITKALEYYDKSMKIFEEIGNKNGIAQALNNIGTIHRNKGDAFKALEYFGNSLKIREELGDKYGVANSLNNIGVVYKNQGNIPKALEYYKKSLKIREEIGEKNGITYTLINLGNLLLKENQLQESFNYANRSLVLARELGFPDNIRNAANLLKSIYKRQNNFKEALQMYELEIAMRDSLNNIETQKATIKQQTQYEYDKKKALADKEHELQLKQQEEKSAAEKTKQNIIIASVSVVLLLVAVFSVFLYNRFKVTQRQKAIIEIKEKETHEQKILIEEKHKEITDSINYAERIQRSFLATQSHLDGNLNPSLRGGTTKQSELTNEKIASHPTGVRNDESNYFIFFQPKDVVSGDFYWSSTLLNGNFALATADSTGHGVPGAIMSLLNITSLEKAIETETSPDKILNLTRTIIIERLKKDGSADGGKDGMDCSVCVYDFKNKKLFIAAAHNPVWIVRTAVISSGVEKDSDLKKGLDSARPDIEVIEIKPDKMPVGKHDRQDIPFTLHEIDLQEGDVIYTLTDGFPDQFGGEKGKKYMSKNLRELLAANAHLPMPEQKELLQKTFSNWKGSLEQIDDVTVIGIRI